MSVLRPLGQILKMACQEKHSLRRGKSNKKKLGPLKQSQSLTDVSLPHSPSIATIAELNYCSKSQQRIFWLGIASSKFF